MACPKTAFVLQIEERRRSSPKKSLRPSVRPTFRFVGFALAFPADEERRKHRRQQQQLPHMQRTRLDFFQAGFGFLNADRGKGGEIPALFFSLSPTNDVGVASAYLKREIIAKVSLHLSPIRSTLNIENHLLNLELTTTN